MQLVLTVIILVFKANIQVVLSDIKEVKKKDWYVCRTSLGLFLNTL